MERSELEAEINRFYTAVYFGRAHLRPGDRLLCDYQHDGAICNKCGYVVPKDARDAEIERLRAALERARGLADVLESYGRDWRKTAKDHADTIIPYGDGMIDAAKRLREALGAE